MVPASTLVACTQSTRDVWLSGSELLATAAPEPVVGLSPLEALAQVVHPQLVLGASVEWLDHARQELARVAVLVEAEAEVEGVEEVVVVAVVVVAVAEDAKPLGMVYELLRVSAYDEVYRYPAVGLAYHIPLLFKFHYLPLMLKWKRLREKDLVIDYALKCWA